MINLSKENLSSLFRAYDIRGLYPDPLSENFIRSLGRAVGELAANRGENTIITGYDGRLSSPRLSSALNSGLLDSGREVINIGLVPTPVLYFAAKTIGTGSGVMLTGSHNPPKFNGCKIMIAGETLFGDHIKQLSDKVLYKKRMVSRLGQFYCHDILPQYSNHILKNIKCQKTLKVAIDCGNGVAGVLAPKLLKELNFDVISLYCDVDGSFPNHHPDPAKPDNLTDLISAVKTHKCDIGFAFDGDGDRVSVITNKGENIYADRVLMLLAEEVLSRNPAGTVVYDVKCSNHLKPFILKCGGKPEMWKTGHSLIKSRMKELNAVLAGEMSGHVFFQDRWFGFDDGIYTACRILEIITSKVESTHEIFSSIPNSFNTPELSIEVEDSKKFEVIEKFSQQISKRGFLKITIDGVRVEFTNGWGLVRASNTTPNIVLRFEADNKSSLIKIRNTIIQCLWEAEPQLNGVYPC